MKNRKNVTRVLFSLITATGLFFTNSVLAADTGSNGEESVGKAMVQKEVQDSTREEAGAKRESIIKEAVSALGHTQTALEAIASKDKQAALDALAMVTGKLEIVVTRDPGLANAPIDVRIEKFDLHATVDAVENAVKQAEDVLKNGEVQQARMILSGLASQMDIVVTSLPLKIYSDGIKAVASLVDEEKFTEASAAIYDLMSTFVVTKQVIPLPILRTELLLKKADQLAQKEGRSEEENKELTLLLDNAKTQIEMAEALGYGDKKEYKGFYRHIKEIRKKTEDGKFGKGFMEGLENSLKEFKKKIFNTTAEEKSN